MEYLDVRIPEVIIEPSDPQFIFDFESLFSNKERYVMSYWFKMTFFSSVRCYSCPSENRFSISTLKKYTSWFRLGESFPELYLNSVMYKTMSYDLLPGDCVRFEALGRDFSKLMEEKAKGVALQAIAVLTSPSSDVLDANGKATLFGLVKYQNNSTRPVYVEKRGQVWLLSCEPGLDAFSGGSDVVKIII